jgi:ubiquitin carboxyl-terminal hydrolase 10
VSSSKQATPTGPKTASPVPEISVQPSAQPAESADGSPAAATPVIKTAPKSWADMVRSNTPQGSGSASANNQATTAASSSSAASKSHAVADVIREFKVNHGGRLSFIEPRGLVNTGNMCYMNSVGTFSGDMWLIFKVLQVLIFCPPFYELLEQVGKRASHSFKGETPVLDAMWDSPSRDAQADRPGFSS